MNGVELTRNIKRDVPDAEVLLYSMHDQERVVVEALQAGARG
jgi:DNA-binding NarL/FixJ family response regulator